MGTDQAWSKVGERIREAREAAGLNQGQVAKSLDLDRTAIVRMEAGQRQLNAMELFRLADCLGVPPAFFVSRPPVAMVSRRAAIDHPTAADRTRFRLDVALETQARDAQWLVDQGVLVPSAPGIDASADPHELARRARGILGRPTGPLGSIVEVAERLGVYLTVVDIDADGASLIADGYGVAVIGGVAEPGRRRWTAVHEIGHHLMRDEYSTDIGGVSASREEREKTIDSFTGEFLLPADELRRALAGAAEGDLRERLISVAVDYRVSWSAVVRRARECGVDPALAQRLQAQSPVVGDFLAVTGRQPELDLLAGERGPQWKRAVLAAYQQGLITKRRALELLDGALVLDDLPDIETM